jgi:Flp pilus assembly protein TadG
MNLRAGARQNRRGQAMLEFTFVGIPIMFVLISIIEISRGMWMYHTMAYSVKDGIRFAIVHGINCANTANNPNNCLKTVKDVAQVIQQAGVGLVEGQTTLTFTPAVTGTPCTITACLALTATTWPPYDSTGATSLDAVGRAVQIDIRTTFRSALAMFWPGSKPILFGAVTLGASSTDYIQF